MRDTLLYAFFKHDEKELILIPEPPELGSVTGDIICMCGEEVTITATPIGVRTIFKH